MIFQDNGGQTFYVQPTTLKVMKGAEVMDEKKFDEAYQFLTSSNSNPINLDRYKKNYVNKIMTDIGTYINEEFDFIPVASLVILEFPKNKKRDYDILEYGLSVFSNTDNYITFSSFFIDNNGMSYRPSVIPYDNWTSKIYRSSYHRRLKQHKITRWSIISRIMEIAISLTKGLGILHKTYLY
jgi:hypothetical protein